MFSHHEKAFFTNEDKKNIRMLYMMRKRDHTFFSSMPRVLINTIFRLTTQWEIASEGGFLTYYYKNGQCYQISEALSNIQPFFLPNNRPIVKVFLAKSLSAFDSSAFYLDNEGHCYASGDNYFGELGLGISAPKFQDKPTLLTLPNNKAIKTLSLGHKFTFIQDIDGDWFGCGSNCLNKLKDTFWQGIRQYRNPVPISLPNNNKIIEIVPGDNHVFMCDSFGSWYGCGNNADGQLGIQLSQLNVLTPIQLPNNKSIKTIKTGLNTTFIQDGEGNWYGCGRNGANQLDIANTFPTTIRLPTLITLPNDKPIKNIVPISDDRTFIQDIDNNWYGVGINYYNQLGINTESSPVNTPLLVQLPNQVGIKKLLGGYHYTFALGEDNIWYGAGHKERLGLGQHLTSDMTFAPIDFSTLDDKNEENLKNRF